MLVVEDSEAIRTAVLAALRDARFTVHGLPDGANLERELESFRPDLVVLDVMLPGRDGFALLDAVRARSDAGVVMLTARDGVADRLRGLRCGADDYLVKPFVLAELVARVTAVLRRLGRAPSTVEVGDLVLEAESGIAVRAGQRLDLTATELRLLGYLAAQRGRGCSKPHSPTAVGVTDPYAPTLVGGRVSALPRKPGPHGGRLRPPARGPVSLPRGPPP